AVCPGIVSPAGVQIHGARKNSAPHDPMQSHTGPPPIPAGYAGDLSASQPRLNVLLLEHFRVVFAPNRRLTSGLESHQRFSSDWLVQSGLLLLGTSAPPRRNPCRETLHMLAQ